jgi:hypothetical protein
MLHCGSMLARKVKLLNPTEHANGGRPIRTIRFNLACCRSYNSDYDGRFSHCHQQVDAHRLLSILLGESIVNLT